MISPTRSGSRNWLRVSVFKIVGQEPPKVDWDGTEVPVDEVIRKFKADGRVLGRDADVAYFMASIAAVESSIRLDWNELSHQPRAKEIAELVMQIVVGHYGLFKPSGALASAQARNFMAILQRLGFV